jgi:uncharacterized membrane protein
MHVIMVHFPLGIFVFGLFLETFSFLWRRSSVLVAARWMVLFGGLLAVPAAVSGIDALKDVSDQIGKLDALREVSGQPGVSDTAWAMLHRHILLASWGAGVAALTTTIALGLSDRWRRRLYYPLLLCLIAGATLMGTGAHFGGEGVYLRGVAVDLKGERATGIEYYAPAQSTHVLMAGFAIALSLGALGASLRVLSTHETAVDDQRAEQELQALEAATRPAEPRRVTDDLSVAQMLNQDAVVPVQPLPAARFWLLGSLVFLVTLGLGVWLLISVEDSDFLQNNKPTASSIYKEVTETALATKPVMNNRRGAHVVIGVILVVLPLVLALAVRFGPRRRWLVLSFCIAILLVIAAELWLGVLLLHDKSEGPLYRFVPPEQARLPWHGRPARVSDLQFAICD